LESDQIPFAALRDPESTDCPLGSDDFIAEAEHRIGVRLRKRKPERKPSDLDGAEQLELRIPNIDGNG
jgi:hypothetical protein